jgi:hypothetical protein
MMSLFVALLFTVRSSVRSRAALQIEVLALRHQLHLLQRSRPHRVRLTPVDRFLWVWLSRAWTEWRARSSWSSRTPSSRGVNDHRYERRAA